MRVVLEIEGEEYDVVLARDGDKLKVTIGGETFDARLAENGAVTLGGKTHQVKIEDRTVTLDGKTLPFRILDYKSGAAGEAAGAARGARIKPPMPGKIVSVAIQEGDEVKPGQVLLILEAMKMQNEIPAPSAGVVKKIHVKPGQNVEGKDVLIELE